VERYISAAVNPRSRTVPVVLMVLIAGLLSAGLWTAADRRRDRPQALDPSMAAVVTELEAFVESARGLRFRHPVDVEVLSASAFRRALSGGEPLEAVDADVEAGVLRALGLLGDSDALDAGDLDADTVAGFYDTETKELVVRGGRLTPFVRQVIVHELTHALDDQHFDLDPDLADDDAALAFDALVEGDAVVVERRYVASMSAAERREAEAEEDATFGGGNVGDIPGIFLDLGDFPYVDGPDLVTALVAAGGQPGVDAAFRSPPTTSAEVLHPARYLSGRGTARVPEVRAGGRVVDEGVVGEFVLRLVLGESWPDEQAGRAADGWAGDRYVAWKTGKRTCVRATVVADNETEAAELLAGLRKWAADHPGANVEPAPAAVTLLRCA
jgi:hypothetical protein